MIAIQVEQSAAKVAKIVGCACKAFIHAGFEWVQQSLHRLDAMQKRLRYVFIFNRT
jgi:hypothetical protein